MGSYCRRDGNCLARSIGNDTVIVPIRGHVADLESVFSLNEVGTRIWNRLDGQTSLDQLVSDVCEEYDASEELVRADTTAFLEKLGELGLIETVGT